MRTDLDKRLVELERRVEELRRVNEQLGRQLAGSGGSRRPRSAVSAARALARLSNERDSIRAELEDTRERLTFVEKNFEGLRLEAERLREETARLRSGALGLLRRGRARLLRH